jgi:hypothetical protein
VERDVWNCKGRGDDGVQEKGEGEGSSEGGRKDETGEDEVAVEGMEGVRAMQVLRRYWRVFYHWVLSNDRD